MSRASRREVATFRRKTNKGQGNFRVSTAGRYWSDECLVDTRHLFAPRIPCEERVKPAGPNKGSGLWLSASGRRLIRVSPLRTSRFKLRCSHSVALVFVG